MEMDTTYDSLEAPVGYHFSEDGALVEGEPVEHGDHGGHGGGHHGGHGKLYLCPDTRPGEFQAYYESWPLGKFYRKVRYRCQYKKGSRMVLRSIFKLMATVNGVKLGS